jgi:phosphoglucosamine mutase
VIFVDERGEIVDGDAVMALCGTRLQRAGRLAKGVVVATVMSNMGLERALSAAGATLRRTQVGDRYVVEEMRREGLTFGGEQSGHLVFAEHATTGDGMVAALQVLAIMLREERPLSELSRSMERVPQVLESIRLATRRPLEEMAELSRRIADAEARLGGDGRVLVRWSGTEPKLRLDARGSRPRCAEDDGGRNGRSRASRRGTRRGRLSSSGERRDRRATGPARTRSGTRRARKSRRS